MNELVKTSPFGTKDKELFIDADTISFQGKSILQEEITGIRYWISAIELDMFTVGRKFHIGLKSPNQQIEIIFRSYLSIGNTYFSTLCNRIVEEVWDQAIDKIWKKETAALLAGETVWFGHCQLSDKGILITKDNLVAKQEKYIYWPDLQYEKKYDRLVLNSKKDYQTYTNLYFKDTWNIEVLIALLDWITKENGLDEIQK